MSRPDTLTAVTSTTSKSVAVTQLTAHHSTPTMTDPGNRERGLKAALSNPRVSEQAKERDRKILATEFGEHYEETPEDAASIEPDREMSSELSDEYEQIAPSRARQTTGLHASSSARPESSSKMSASETTQPPSSKTRDTRRLSTGASQGEIDGKDAGNVYVSLLAGMVSLSHSMVGAVFAVSSRPSAIRRCRSRPRRRTARSFASWGRRWTEGGTCAFGAGLCCISMHLG